MNIYSNLIRITLFFAAMSLVVIGCFFFIQHWSGGRIMMGVGVLLQIGMLVDFFRRRKR